MPLRKYTVDDIMNELNPCEWWPRKRIADFFRKNGKTTITELDVLLKLRDALNRKRYSANGWVKNAPEISAAMFVMYKRMAAKRGDYPYSWWWVSTEFAKYREVTPEVLQSVAAAIEEAIMLDREP